MNNLPNDILNMLISGIDQSYLIRELSVVHSSPFGEKTSMNTSQALRLVRGLT